MVASQDLVYRPRLNKIITDLYNYMILGSERIKLVREAERIDQLLISAQQTMLTDGNSVAFQ